MSRAASSHIHLVLIGKEQWKDTSRQSLGRQPEKPVRLETNI